MSNDHHSHSSHHSHHAHTLSRSDAPPSPSLYTCPMHPQIRQDHPGNCPICGMALEPVTVATDTSEESSEARDMTRRFWISAALSLPVLILAMAHLIPGFHLDHWIPPRINQWLQFAFSTPAVLWAGWPFFVRGWKSLLTRHLNMFTLIALGVGTAYAFSVIALLFPHVFPPAFQVNGVVPLYFEAAAIITTLVLLGHPISCWPSCRRSDYAELRNEKRGGSSMILKNRPGDSA